MNERVITVSRSFLAQLNEYLEPTERFLAENGGLVLLTLDPDNAGQAKKLIFKAGQI